jgi:DNA-binding LacI/PurR family transcriptional regulator
MQGSEHVSEEKRQRVLEAAASLGYLNNGIATSLAGNRSHCMVGFLAQSLSNPVFVDVYESLVEELRAHGHRVVLMQGGFDPEEEDHSLRDLVTLRPDGVVLVGYAGSTSALGAAVNSLPVVAVTRQIEMSGVSSVYSDDRMSADLAVDHLVALGHRDIAHLALPADIPYEGRADGYRKAMARHGLPDRVVFPELSARGAAEMVHELMTEGSAPTALFCGNDVLALGALDALARLGVRVPEDISVVGHDNTSFAARMGLTSVDQHARQQGRIAAEILMRMIEQENLKDEIETRRLLPRLVVRRTTSLPPSPR